MKTYSNDPQDWTVEDACIEEFDHLDWKDLVPDMIKYFHNNEYALDSFKEWWVEQRIKEIENEPKDYDY
jgi:hypothetical protein